MAEKYIVNMPLKTTPDDTDLMIIEDAQDTKRMTWANVVKPIKDLVDNIIESGSNANGSYIKFDDGTMTCMMSGTITLLNMVQTSNGLWRFQGDNIPYPATFVELPWWQMKLQASEEINVANRSTATTYFNPMLYLISDRSNVSINYTCIAIGRWK